MLAVPERRSAPASCPSAKEATSRPMSSNLRGGTGGRCQDPSQQVCRQKDKARVSTNMTILFTAACTWNMILLEMDDWWESMYKHTLYPQRTVILYYYLRSKTPWNNDSHFEIFHKTQPLKSVETLTWLRAPQCCIPSKQHSAHILVKSLKKFKLYFLLHSTKRKRLIFQSRGGFVCVAALRPCCSAALHTAAHPHDAQRAAHSTEPGTMCEVQMWSKTS